MRVASAVLLGAGAAAVVTALATYFARYSAFDALEGEIDADLYVAITRMATTERAALAIGAVLVVAGVLLLVRRRRVG